jgi:AraC family transcriptional regulator
MTHGEEANHDHFTGSGVDQARNFRDLGHVAGRNELIHVPRFERVIMAMNRRLDKPMTNSNMADIACLSPCHFNRLFHHATGIPPIQFHYALRLDRAKRLLVGTDLSITEICFEVGYNSLGTFTSRFNQLVGLSPSAFRNLARKFASTRLSDLGALLLEAADMPAPSRNICGTVSSAGYDGLIFTALFPRGIPEGVPAVCAVTSDPGPYCLPNPGYGIWRVFALAIPWAATGTQLITLDGLHRGRSGLIRAEGNSWSGASKIELTAARVLDPPILASIPVLLSRMLANRASQSSSQRSLRTTEDASFLS